MLPPDAEHLIRSELFGLERLEKHAESLAEAQPVTANPRTGRRLDRRLEDNGRALFDAYCGVEKAVRDERHITPADEFERVQLPSPPIFSVAVATGLRVPDCCSDCAL